jgi:SsrA-binding protein
MKQTTGQKLISQNRRARHAYDLLDSFEAGLELQGGEVKSLRAGQVSIAEAYVRLAKGEAWLIGAYIKPYGPSGGTEETAARDRKLLLHKNELAQLFAATQEKNLTIIPLRLYFKRGKAKLEISVARGRKRHDKRAAIKAREQRREAERAVRDAEKK